MSENAVKSMGFPAVFRSSFSVWAGHALSCASSSEGPTRPPGMRRAGPCAGERSNALGNGRVDPEQMWQAPCHGSQKAGRTVVRRAGIRTRNAASPRGAAADKPGAALRICTRGFCRQRRALGTMRSWRHWGYEKITWRTAKPAAGAERWPPSWSGRGFRLAMTAFPKMVRLCRGGAAHGHRSERRCTDRF